jgi:hypothetical protein
MKEEITRLFDYIEARLPMLEEIAVGKVIESTRYPKKGRKAFKAMQYSDEIKEARKWYEEKNGVDYGTKWKYIQHVKDTLDTIPLTNDTRDVMSIHSMITKPPQEHTPPLDKTKIPKGHCKNTGKPIHYRYKNNKAIDGRKKKDCCPCSACLKLRWSRDEEISEYRKGLKKKRSKKKKDPKRYK